MVCTACSIHYMLVIVCFNLRDVQVMSATLDVRSTMLLYMTFVNRREMICNINCLWISFGYIVHTTDFTRNILVTPLQQSHLDKNVMLNLFFLFKTLNVSRLRIIQASKVRRVIGNHRYVWEKEHAKFRHYCEFKFQIQM